MRSEQTPSPKETPGTQRRPRDTTGEGGDTGDHRRVWDLLPWLANDTLEGDELVLVLDHLKACDDCRQELRFLPELRLLAEQAESAIGDSPDRLAPLMERIEAHEEAGTESCRESSAIGSRPWVSRGWARLRDLLVVPNLWRPVLVPAFVLALVAGLWLGRPTDPAPRFTTLSDAGAEQTPVEGTLVRLVFASGTSEAAMRRLLLEIGGEIVSGPNRAGAYGVRLPDDTGRDTLAELRQRGMIALAEPVLAVGEKR